MNPAQLERLCEHLLKLRLFKSRERLEALLQHAADKELAYSDFLEQVLSEEVAAKTSKNVTMRTSMARFPFVNRWRPSTSPTSPRSTRNRCRRLPPATSSSMAITCWSSARQALARATSRWPWD